MTDNVVSRLDKMRQKVVDQRQYVFNQLNEIAPDIVRDMKLHQAEFGAFAAVEIRINGELVYSRGELLPAKFYTRN